MTGWRGRRWAVITSVVGTVFIAAGAFWLSFTALADLAPRSGIGAGQAWAWPLIVDGVIVVSTVAVVALAGERAAWYPWTLLIGGAAVSVTANALHAIVAADADVPAGSRGGGRGRPARGAAGLDASDRRPHPHHHPARRAAAERGRESVALAVRPTEPPAVVSPTRSWRGSSLSRCVDRRVRAAGLRESGWSNKKIARSLDVHPSTVGRWFADAHHLDEPEQTGSEPILEGATP